MSGWLLAALGAVAAAAAAAAAAAPRPGSPARSPLRPAPPPRSYVNYNSALDPAAAERALDQLNYTPLAGRPMRIMWSHRDPAFRKSGAPARAAAAGRRRCRGTPPLAVPAAAGGGAAAALPLGGVSGGRGRSA